MREFSSERCRRAYDNVTRSDPRTAVGRDYVSARTDAKAFAVNPEGHCGFNTTARSLEEAKKEAVKLCSGRWPECKL